MSSKNKRRKKKDLGAEELLKRIGSAAEAEKRRLSPELEQLIRDVGRCYTETGRAAGSTEGDDLMNLIGASASDELADAGMPLDANQIAARLQSDAARKQRQADSRY